MEQVEVSKIGKSRIAISHPGSYFALQAPSFALKRPNWLVLTSLLLKKFTR
jgi:hypothetical protein